MKNVSQNVLVTYSSEHGTTKEISNYIADSIDANTIVMSVNQASNLTQYDYVVIGTPIYNQQPTYDMKNFINNQTEELKNVDKSVFVVTSDVEDNNKREENINAFMQLVPGTIDENTTFAGSISYEELNTHEKESVDSYFNSIQKPKGSYNKIDINACRKFGKKISEVLKTK